MKARRLLRLIERGVSVLAEQEYYLKRRAFSGTAAFLHFWYVVEAAICKMGLMQMWIASHFISALPEPDGVWPWLDFPVSVEWRAMLSGLKVAEEGFFWRVASI